MMSSEGVFIIAEDGEFVLVEIPEDEFLESVGRENVVLAGQFDGEEFYPQGGAAYGFEIGTKLLSGGVKAAATVAKTLYKNVYKYVAPTAEKSIVKEIASVEKIANIAPGTGALSKGAQLGTFEKVVLSKADELQSAVSASANKIDVSKILRAGETGNIADAKVALARLDTVLADSSATKLMAESELNVFKTSRQSLDDALKQLDRPVNLTGEGGAIAREELVMSTQRAASTIDDAGKFRVNYWSTLEKEIPGIEKVGLKTEGSLLGKAATKTDDVLARERILAEEAAAAERKLAEEALVKTEAGLFGNISRETVAKYGLAAALGLVATSAAVGIVSAGSLGDKAGSGVEPSSKVEAARMQFCRELSDWAKVTDQPEKLFAICRNCVVTGDETKEEVEHCFSGKTGPTDPCVLAPDEQTRVLCVACQTEVSDPTSVDQLNACIQRKYSNQPYDPYNPVPSPIPGPNDTVRDICDNSDLDPGSLALCKECQKISSHPQDVDLISKCILDKKQQMPSGEKDDICDMANLDAETWTLCKECQKEVKDPQDGTLLGECIAIKRSGGPGAVTGDICDTSGLDAETLALCKECQNEVTEPQDVSLVSECLRGKVGSSGMSPCDDPRAQLTDEEYRACVNCYVDGMTIEDLQDCMIGMLAKTTGGVPVCDVNNPSFDLSVCIGKICNPDDPLFDLDACYYYTGVAEQPYYGGGAVVQDTMDPCDTTSQMFDATGCTNLGGEVYTSEVLAESPPNMVFPLLLLGGAVFAVVAGFRDNGPARKKR